MNPEPPKARPIAVAIVEENAAFRHQLAQYLEGAAGFRCACACASAEEALQLIPDAAPDVVLMGIQLPRMNGITCAAMLRAKLPSVPVMMLTGHEDTETIFDALKAGAKGYLLKRDNPAKLLAAIEELHQGGAPMSSQVARKVIDSFRRPPPLEHPQDRLTEREQEILTLLAQGQATREVAERLGVSYETIRWHLRHIYDKLHVHTLTEAVLRRHG